MGKIKITNRNQKKAIAELYSHDQLKDYDMNIEDFILEMEQRGMTDGTHVKEYSKRITDSRESHSYSKIEVARLLGVSHTAIKDEEQGTKKKISLHLLLGFSLLYHVSPLFLVGETNDKGCYNFKNLTHPMDFFDPTLTNTVDFILVNLYKNLDDWPGLNSMLLEIISQLCDASFEWNETIRHTLLNSPVLKVMCETPLDFTSIVGESSKIFRAQLKKLGMPFKNKTEIEIYQERFYRFGTTDFHTLTLFAHISCAEPHLKEGICFFLKYGGFLDNRKHFRQNDERKKLSDDQS